MKLSVEQLATHHKKKNIFPVYIVSGDEPLMVQEAADLIRGFLKNDGIEEREIWHVDSKFSWSEMFEKTNNLSLFTQKSLVELRFVNKINAASQKAMIEYLQNVPEDKILLIIMPKVDTAAQNSKWFKEINKIAAFVPIWPVNREQLPRWLRQRLLKAGFDADEAAIEYLAQHVEGNLLAANQEIMKLQLAFGGDGLLPHSVRSVVPAKAGTHIPEADRSTAYPLSAAQPLSSRGQAAGSSMHNIHVTGSRPIHGRDDDITIKSDNNRRPLTYKDIANFISQHATYTVFDLADSFLDGDTKRYLSILSQLKQTGIAPSLILWSLAREARLVAKIKSELAKGKQINTIFYENRVWDKKKPAVNRALKKFSQIELLIFLKKCAEIDFAIKGLKPGNAWVGLERLILRHPANLTAMHCHLERSERSRPKAAS